MKELKKSTRREPVSRKKNTAEKKEQTAKKSTKKNTGKEIKKENKKDTEKGTWKSVTKERVYDPNGKVLVITYACVVLFLALLYTWVFSADEKRRCDQQSLQCQTGQHFQTAL